MKKLVEVQEVSGEGFMALIGEKVLVLCVNLIYTGVLVGVNDTCILLRDASVVYETGAFTATTYKDAQKIAEILYIQTAAIESFCKSDK